MQFDPALRELFLRKTGKLPEEIPSEEVTSVEIPVVARLVDPVIPVESLRIVARFGTVVTGRVSLNRIVEVRRNENIASLKASVNFTPTLAFSVPEIQASPEVLRRVVPEGVTGSGVVVAAIDWGICFAHKNFRDEHGNTRLLCLWDQRGGAQIESPQPFGYGREYKREQLNAALGSSDPYTALDYDPADADPNGTGSHGTHVLDIAAGNGAAPTSSPGVAPEAELIFVHLRGEDTRPQDTLGDSVRLLEAVRYVCDRAGDRPVVINLSLGKTGGPHDGSTLLEIGLHNLLNERPGLVICSSTGNYYGADLASSGQVRTGQSVELKWRATPRNDEVVEMEIWYAGSDVLSVELIDPGGRNLARIALGENAVIRDKERIIASIYHRQHDPNNNDNQIDIFLWPEAPVGTWITRLHGENVKVGRYHAWIERDDPLFQSRFTPEYAVQLHTTGTIANGNTIAVGAYDARDPSHPLVPFSSSGPTRDGRLKPDISAPGAGIRAARSSQVRKGYREMNGTTVKTGTSMAAPHVSGCVALMLQACGEYRPTVEQIRQILIFTSRKFPPYEEMDRLRYGAGRLNAAAAVRAAAALGESVTKENKSRVAATLVSVTPLMEAAKNSESGRVATLKKENRLMKRIPHKMWAEQDDALQSLLNSRSIDLTEMSYGREGSFEWALKGKPVSLDHPVEDLGESEGGVIAAAGLGFEILKSAIVPMVQGDINAVLPTSTIGVRWPGKPASLNLVARSRSALIIDYVDTLAWPQVERVNVKLRCHVTYNGPEVEASFMFDAEGRRSRAGRDSSVIVNNPLSLETRPAPADWQRIGVTQYPVVRVPVEFRVDNPWPLSNYNETFMLVLSGMYGFGASAGLYYKENRRVVST